MVDITVVVGTIFVHRNVAATGPDNGCFADRSDPHLYPNATRIETEMLANFFLARCVLTNALMPVLQRNKDSRVIHLAPNNNNNADNYADNTGTAMKPPCPTATPTGTDFSWWNQGIIGIACCEVAFLTTSSKATNQPVVFLMIRAGGAWNALPSSTLSEASSSSSSCWDCLWNVVRRLGQNDPVALVASLENILLADPMEFPRMDGRIFDCGKNGVTETAVTTLTTPGTLLTEWEEWTADYLARHQKN